MTDKVHPLVELLVARAKSHPDEFKEDIDSIASSDRWWRAISVISRNGTDADKALLASTVGRIAMDRAHEWALDELLNGEERREAERRRQEEDQKRYLAQQTTSLKQQSQLYAQAAHNSYQNAISGISGISSPTMANSSITLGDQTLTAGMLSQIKKALGVK
jgi:hypothetical protein